MADPIIDQVREKHKAKQEAAKQKREEFKEAVESGSKKLVLDRDEVGNYTARWEGGGTLPPFLKGRWTSVARIIAAAESRYGKGIVKL